MATKARQQYFADELSLQKQSREFSIADDIQQKIDSVESGAQENVIEIVKVNGTALTPDANKAVDVEVPEVIDNLSSTSADDALSAKQGKILYDYIQNIASRGRFLSNWNCATGLPVTNPTTSPYIYMAGDYYSVSNVATGGGTNYRPDGSSYTIGQASTTAETEVVNVSDFYLYDGTNWLLLVNTERQIAVDSSLSTTSTNPVENRVITNAINGKQNTLTAGSHISIVSDTISTTGLQEELTAGENITIGDECTTESDMKGPCPKGFHVPTYAERDGVKTIMDGLSLTSINDWVTNLHMPLAGGLSRIDASKTEFSTQGRYYTSSAVIDEPSYVRSLMLRSSGVGILKALNSGGNSIRCFKNSYESPTSGWTVIQGTLGNAGIFWNQTDGLISITSDGVTGYTIMDKNLGATIVYSSGDVLNESNCGGYFQWGNNYMFPFAGPSSTSSTQVDVSNYGPGNYYSSNVYIIQNYSWTSQINNNLRGGVTQGTFQDCIHNVISATDTTYTAGTGINIDANNEISNTGVTSLSGQTGDVELLYYGSGIPQDAFPGKLRWISNPSFDFLQIRVNGDWRRVAPDEVVIGATAPAVAEGLLWYDTANDVLKSCDGTNWNLVDTRYTAGEGIEIKDLDYSAMRGPAPKGYHVPTHTEVASLITKGVSLSVWSSSDGTGFINYLKAPKGGFRRNTDASITNQDSTGFFWCCDANITNGYYINFSATRVSDTLGNARSMGFSIRPFKDKPVIPDNSWTTLYDGSNVASGAGIFHNVSEGIISISDDGVNWITIADKNCGATTVYNTGDTLSEANCGKYYQRGNNYGFPWTGSVTTSSTRVDASVYGPGNYYSSSTRINVSADWSSVRNDNLRGGVTGVLKNAITNIAMPTVISSDGTTYYIAVSNSDPASGTASNIITLVP